jgi:hypothetical protein
MQQVIYLEVDDDMPAVRDLLEGAQAKRVLLVVPAGCRTFQNSINLRMLRRYAGNLALDVALVTRDSRSRRLAKEEGVPTLSFLRQGRRGRWRLRAPYRSEAQKAAEARVRGLRYGRGDIGWGDVAIVWAGRMVGVLLFLLFFGLVLGLAALVVPQAEVTIVPYREVVKVDLELRADPEAEKADLASLTIPARIVEAQVEQTGETPTVSKRDAPDTPATGTVTFINQAATPLEILPGAIIRTSTGTTIRFKTVSTATLAANIGATAQAQIEALEPGPVGNVPAATINEIETGGLRGRVRVTNEQATQGGGVKQVGVVTRADMDRLKAQMLQQLQQQAFLDLQAQLKEQEFLPPDSMTIEIMSEVYDQFLDSEADVLKCTMRVFASGTAVDEWNAKNLAYQALKDKIPATYELESEEITFGLDDQVRMDGRSVVVGATASAPLVVEVDRGAVRSTVAGLTESEAQQALTQSFALNAPPAVDVQPEWIKRWQWLDRVPLLPFRIQVIVQE